MAIKVPQQEEMLKIGIKPPRRGWMDIKAEFRPGTFNFSGVKKHIEYLGLANPRDWQPYEEDWKLPENWKEIILDGFKKRLERSRGLKIFLDTCVRCGACADKCHYFIGSGDPKNMPVLRTELLRSVYKRYFTMSGKIFGKWAGARDLTVDVLKEWFYYFYQCTECRRCSVFCPYGIDTAEITMLARELMDLVGVNINWIIEPASNCFRTGNHLGIQPHTFRDNIEFAVDEINELTGIKIEPSINRKGAEILFIIPSADIFADPHIFTFYGYVMLFHEIGLDYTFSAYASEGGDFGLFHSVELMKRLNAKIYAEAKRLGVKWIMGGECGHMWRVMHQYMDTVNGPADFLEVPVSPVTKTRFDNARSTRMIHICEFTSDLIYNKALTIDPARNNAYHVTLHDSCNPSRAMGLLEEPRHIIKNVCQKFTEMPENTIREQTFCCGSGAGLGTDENIEMRLRGGLPRANAVKYVRDTYGVNMVACICAIDKATLPALMNYWTPGVDVCGVHELVGNAIVMKGEKKRETNLRNEPFSPPEGSGNA
jgi:Fe-S oxidoreductase